MTDESRSIDALRRSNPGYWLAIRVTDHDSLEQPTTGVLLARARDPTRLHERILEQDQRTVPASAPSRPEIYQTYAARPGDRTVLL